MAQLELLIAILDGRSTNTVNIVEELSGHGKEFAARVTNHQTHQHELSSNAFFILSNVEGDNLFHALKQCKHYQGLPFHSQCVHIMHLEHYSKSPVQLTTSLLFELIFCQPQTPNPRAKSLHADTIA